MRYSLLVSTDDGDEGQQRLGPSRPGSDADTEGNGAWADVDVEVAETAEHDGEDGDEAKA